ncbi:lytic murein transglycosylase [Gallaecimonas xiamenensis]|uniref:Membrane-bound lytic murein transglycosylase B n=1 Tax=Gallaecimonas xiamenensis 3-C-1 TaxID=745411 RepID=K2JVA1_9GAMM|nr:lytic murein transglycosylase [Gallaecimonas xiamenensis]EKE69125.1 membrane-bound lytic murein transglycosylase B [Gallaecimonas xiamenensis 3-C-1]
MKKLLLASLLVLPLFSQGAEERDFGVYVGKLKAEALTQGITQGTLDKAFEGVTLLQRVIEADRSQPESKLTMEGYLSRTVPAWKVKQARAQYRENRALLEKIGQAYGVQPQYIVALWAKESSFGKVQGNFSVISALTSMAFEGRRESFFKDELFAALKILQQGHVDMDHFKGSWAGAMGQTQFMPSSFLALAVDGDGDGKKDIWSNKADVFASIANYLAKAGWKGDQAWGRQVKVPADFDWAQKDEIKSLDEWAKLGLSRFDGGPLPKVADMKAQLKAVDGPKGRIYLVYNNYQVLKRWNRSDYFATGVGLLANGIIWPPLEAK